MYLNPKEADSKLTLKYKDLVVGQEFHFACDDKYRPDIHMRISTPNKTQKLSVDLEDGVARTYSANADVVCVDVVGTWEDD